jgi:hypothetical protein
MGIIIVRFKLEENVDFVLLTEVDFYNHTLPKIFYVYKNSILFSNINIRVLAPWLQNLLITLKYSTISDLHNFKTFYINLLSLFSLAFTVRFLATDLNTETSTSNQYEFFLLFRLHHAGTSEQKFFRIHSSSLRLTRNCPERILSLLLI